MRAATRLLKADHQVSRRRRSSQAPRSSSKQRMRWRMPWRLAWKDVLIAFLSLAGMALIIAHSTPEHLVPLLDPGWPGDGAAPSIAAARAAMEAKPPDLAAARMAADDALRRSPLNLG